jgi:DNA-binding response OmpR family regulator
MPHRRLRILVVDDHEDTVEFMRLRLSDEGHIVFALSDVTRLDDILLSQDLDVLLLDLMFSDKNAVSEIPRIHSRFAHLKIIVMSGTPDFKMTLSAIDAGADSYLTKPVEWDQLAALLNNVKVA